MAVHLILISLLASLSVPGVAEITNKTTKVCEDILRRQVAASRLATSQIRQGDLEAAALSLVNAIEEQPDNAPLRASFIKEMEKAARAFDSLRFGGTLTNPTIVLSNQDSAALSNKVVGRIDSFIQIASTKIPNERLLHFIDDLVLFVEKVAPVSMQKGIFYGNRITDSVSADHYWPRARKQFFSISDNEQKTYLAEKLSTKLLNYGKPREAIEAMKLGSAEQTWFFHGNMILAQSMLHEPENNLWKSIQAFSATVESQFAIFFSAFASGHEASVPVPQIRAYAYQLSILKRILTGHARTELTFTKGWDLMEKIYWESSMMANRIFMMHADGKQRMCLLARMKEIFGQDSNRVIEPQWMTEARDFLGDPISDDHEVYFDFAREY